MFNYYTSKVITICYTNDNYAYACDNLYHEAYAGLVPEGCTDITGYMKKILAKVSGQNVSEMKTFDIDEDYEDYEGDICFQSITNDGEYAVWTVSYGTACDLDVTEADVNRYANICA